MAHACEAGLRGSSARSSSLPEVSLLPLLFWPMAEPVLSRAVVGRLRAPDELQLAQRILSAVAAAVESRVDRVATSAAAREDSAVAASFVAREAAAAERRRGAAGSERPLEGRQEILLAARELRALRCDFKRFSDFYRSGHLLPISIFKEAVHLGREERLQKRTHSFSAETFKRRAELLKEYLRLRRALFLLPPPKGAKNDARLRANGEGGVASWHSAGVVTRDPSEGTLSRRAETEIILVTNGSRLTRSACLLQCEGGGGLRRAGRFCASQKSKLVVFWSRFEKQFLREKEEHAVAALRPLVACVAAAEAVFRSCNKERVLPEPAATEQRICTFRALQCFCTSVARLSQDLLSVMNNFTFLEAQSLVFAAAVVDAAEGENTVSVKTSETGAAASEERPIETPGSESVRPSAAKQASPLFIERQRSGIENVRWAPVRLALRG